MRKFCNKTMRLFGVALMLSCGMGAANAASMTYSYLVTGDMLIGDETFANAFNLTAGDTVTAYGTFTADLSGGATVLFGSGSGNTMTIDLNGTLLYASDDANYGTGSNPSLTFDNTQALTDFYYQKTTTPAFNSSFLFFDNLNGSSSMLGQWQSNVALTPVPVPAALWLFGSGLLGLVGLTKRKKRN